MDYVPGGHLIKTSGYYCGIYYAKPIHQGKEMLPERIYPVTAARFITGKGAAVYDTIHVIFARGEH
jgi:hypothetical protein